jgi:methylmalonyl-CoA/ethylmalonyl-CoA epimerase
LFQLDSIPEIGKVAKSVLPIFYRGESTTGYGKSAFFDMDSVHIEIIEPVGRPSIWDEFLRTRGVAIHHFAVKTE